MAESLSAVSWVAVFLGGGLGSVLRFGLAEGMRMWLPEATAAFPWGVLAANLLATALLAWCTIAGADVWGRHSPFWLFMTVGVCGGFSTFSTFAWDTLRLFNQSGWALAAGNILISVAGCVVAGWAISKACASTTT